MLRIYAVILELVRELRPVISRIEQRDVDRARQMRRALASVPLNTAEGSYSRGRNRAARYHTAAGSMREVGAALDVALALGYVEQVESGVLDRLGLVVTNTNTKPAPPRPSPQPAPSPCAPAQALAQALAVSPAQPAPSLPPRARSYGGSTLTSRFHGPASLTNPSICTK